MTNSLLSQMRLVNTNSYPCVLDKSPGPYLLLVLVAGLDGEYLQHIDALLAYKHIDTYFLVGGDLFGCPHSDSGRVYSFT